ncbi:MAG: cytochrome oxidase [Deltaproteobacteria bacterium]|nr:cytochrome oxidase [Deltaproteobacteria bacterium]
MSALAVTLFCSGGILAFTLLAFFSAYSRREHEHTDRLSLLPLEDDNP